MGPRPGRTKTAVDRVGRGKERQVNIRFLAMANHYVFEPPSIDSDQRRRNERLLQSGRRLGLRRRGATGSSPLAQGQVEKNVQNSRRQVLQEMPGFPDLATMNAWLEQRCLEMWHETPHGTLPGTIADVWAEERAALMPLPPALTASSNSASASRPPA